MANNIGNLQNKNGDMLFPDNMQVIVNSNGIALKFSNGYLITMQSKYIDVAVNDAWGNMAVSASFSFLDFPVAFTTIPYIYKFAQTDGSNGFIMGAIQNPPTKTNPGGYAIARGTTGTFRGYVNVLAIGKWK